MSTTDVLSQLIADLSRDIEAMGFVVEAAVAYYDSRMTADDRLDMCGMRKDRVADYDAWKRLEAAVRAYKMRGTK